MISRRELLIGGLGAAGLGALGLPRGAGARGLIPGRKFLFVFARGGWDTTRCFSPLLGLPSVESEEEAVASEASGIPFVDHPDRPSVRAFFRDFGDQTAVINGMLVRSVNHSVCERLVITADSRPGSADWATRIGAPWAADLAIPSIVLSGPSEPGKLHRFSAVSGSGDQLQALVDGSSAGFGSRTAPRLPPATEEVVDRYMRQRSAEAVAATGHPARRRMLEAYDDGLTRALRLRDDAASVSLRHATFEEDLTTAVDLLGSGVCRCASVAMIGWDTHTGNDLQSAFHEQLFRALLDTIALLRDRPGSGGGLLVEETVVVVLSEMGRTPYLNLSKGKDHWPYTSAMLVGAGVAGGRSIGGYDAQLSGLQADLRTGALSTSGAVITPDHLGATLLTLAGLDASVELPGAEAIRYLLA